MKTFNALVKDTETGKKAAIRAFQAWQFLIANSVFAVTFGMLSTQNPFGQPGTNDRYL